MQLEEIIEEIIEEMESRKEDIRRDLAEVSSTDMNSYGAGYEAGALQEITRWIESLKEIATSK